MPMNKIFSSLVTSLRSKERSSQDTDASSSTESEQSSRKRKVSPRLGTIIVEEAVEADGTHSTAEGVKAERDDAIPDSNVIVEVVIDKRTDFAQEPVLDAADMPTEAAIAADELEDLDTQAALAAPGDDSADDISSMHESEANDSLPLEDGVDVDDLDALLDSAEQEYKQQEQSKLKHNTSSSQRIKLPRLKSGLEDPSVLYIRDAKGGVSQVKKLVSTSDDKQRGSLERLTTQPVVEQKLSKKQIQEARAATLGPKWFDMPAVTITPEIKRDLQILKLRNVLDPKRFYKRGSGEIGVVAGTKPTKKGEPEKRYFQTGTLIEGPHEYFSARMSKKEAKNSIVDEIMADTERQQYYKRKFNEVHSQRSSGGKGHYKSIKAKRQKRQL